LKALHTLRALLAATVLAIALPSIGHAQVLSNYLENKLADFVFRGQAFTPASTLYVGLSTAACSDAGVGTEVTGGSYSRVAVTSSMANWSGTQAAASTTASTGTGGRISNNNAITFPTPTAGWGTVSHVFLIDASSGGNLYVCIALSSSKSISTGDPVSFSPNTLGMTLQ
jgi:hypothetical protein